MTHISTATHSRHPNDWSETDTAKLRDLAQQNLSSRTIAASFPGKSRNAILGKAFRLGIHIRSTDCGRRYSGFWSTADHFERLRELYFSPLGYANAEIAAEFGIGIPTLRRGIAKMKATDGQLKTRPNRHHGNGGTSKPRRRPRTVAERARARATLPGMTDLQPATDLSAAVTIMGLDETHTKTCRWPVSGEGHAMLYCGCRPIVGIPYCGPHARRAYAT